MDFYNILEYPAGDGNMPAEWIYDGVHPNAVGYTIMGDNATILLNSLNPTEFSVYVAFSMNAVISSENNNVINVIVNKDAVAEDVLTVDINTSLPLNSYAVSGVDFEPISETLTFNASELQKTIPLYIYYYGGNISLNKSILVSLSNPTLYGTLGDPSQLLVTINATNMQIWGAKQENKPIAQLMPLIILAGVLSVFLGLAYVAYRAKDNKERFKLIVLIFIYVTLIALVLEPQVTNYIISMGV
jgi:hypothetical protein